MLMSIAIQHVNYEGHDTEHIYNAHHLENHQSNHKYIYLRFR